MRDKYKELYKQAVKAYTTILFDKMNIEQGVKEKPCFKPIIEVIELALLCGILKSYIAQLEKVIDKLKETEGAGNESS